MYDNVDLCRIASTLTYINLHVELCRIMECALTYVLLHVEIWRLVCISSHTQVCFGVCVCVRERDGEREREREREREPERESRNRYLRGRYTHACTNTHT